MRNHSSDVRFFQRICYLNWRRTLWDASSVDLRLGNCREYRVFRPHHIVRLTTEWTISNTRFFLRYARGAKNLERLAAFLAGYDLLHRRTRKVS
jgi:hypothetical protein